MAQEILPVPSESGPIGTDQGIRPDKLAIALEERGFECMLVAEHSHIPVGFEALRE